MRNDPDVDINSDRPWAMTGMMEMNIVNAFYGRNGWEGVGQAKAVIFTILVAILALAQNRLTRSKEVQQ